MINCNNINTQIWLDVLHSIFSLSNWPLKLFNYWCGVMAFTLWLRRLLDKFDSIDHSKYWHRLLFHLIEWHWLQPFFMLWITVDLDEFIGFNNIWCEQSHFGSVICCWFWMCARDKKKSTNWIFLNWMAL